jgi:hypothetical protein
MGATKKIAITLSYLITMLCKYHIGDLQSFPSLIKGVWKAKSMRISVESRYFSPPVELPDGVHFPHVDGGGGVVRLKKGDDHHLLKTPLNKFSRKRYACSAICMLDD